MHPFTFQAIMNSICHHYLHKFVLVFFFYDILIYSPNWIMHLKHVKKAFELSRHHQFFIKIRKCAFGQQELEYLGHIITPQGIKVDQRKIEAMFNWPRQYFIIAWFFRSFRLLQNICMQLQHLGLTIHQFVKQRPIWMARRGTKNIHKS